MRHDSICPLLILSNDRSNIINYILIVAIIVFGDSMIISLIRMTHIVYKTFSWDYIDFEKLLVDQVDSIDNCN